LFLSSYIPALFLSFACVFIRYCGLLSCLEAKKYALWGSMLSVCVSIHGRLFIAFYSSLISDFEPDGRI
jgi:hypothetical protein